MVDHTIISLTPTGHIIEVAIFSMNLIACLFRFVQTRLRFFICLSFFSFLFLLSSIIRLVISLGYTHWDTYFKSSDTLVDLGLGLYVGILLYRLNHFRGVAGYIPYLCAFFITLNMFFFVTGFALRVTLVFNPKVSSLYDVTRIITVIVCSISNIVVNYIVAHLVYSSSKNITTRKAQVKKLASLLYRMLFAASFSILTGILLASYFQPIPPDAKLSSFDATLYIVNFLGFPLHFTFELVYQFYLTLIVMKGAIS